MTGTPAANRSVAASLERVDWSGSLGASSQSSFAEALLEKLVLDGEITAIAVDPIQGYLAVGTSSGSCHLFGSPAARLGWTLRPSQPVQFLLFKPGTPLLIVADNKENLSIYDLSRPDPAAQAKAHTRDHRGSASGAGNLLQPHPDTPTRIAAMTARNAITTLHLSPTHSHLFIGLRDGTVDTYDLDRLHSSPWRAPNCWYEEEELLRKSGVPDAPPRRHVPLVVDMATSPIDPNRLLLAYEGGAVLLDIKQKAVTSSYQLRLLPGAPGAGGVPPEALWTERGSPVVSLAWAPCGTMFALGHEDGLISFWSVQDDSKPLLVRSLAELDVDKPTVEELGFRPPREPIFKMAWSGFPGKGWLDSLNKTEDDASSGAPSTTDLEAGTTILTVLGGAVADQDPPGLVTLQFPPQAAAPPSASAAATSFWGASTSSAAPAPDVLHKTRQRLRASLETTRETRLLSNGGVVQDFVLLPRSSPHYSMAWDPVAIIMLVDLPHGLPPLAPPSAQRGLIAAMFPPLPAPGAQHSSSNRGSMIPSTSDRAMHNGPVPAVAPEFIAHHPLTLPFALECTGAGAVVGAELINVSLSTYRKLVGPPPNEEESVQRSDAPLPLKGGTAAASLVGDVTLEQLARASGGLRLLMTRHCDGTIRFADASQHLVLMPEAGLPQKPPDSDRLPMPSFLDRAFPTPLPNLTISVTQTLMHPSLSGQGNVARVLSSSGRVRITSVHFAPEVIEVTVVVAGGIVVHYKHDHARSSQSQEVEAQIQEEMLRERQGAEAAAFNTISAQHQQQQQQKEIPAHAAEMHLLQEREGLAAGEQLEGDMQRAMRDLDVRSGAPASADPAATPPPRPKRDPKRGSIFKRFGGGEGANDAQASRPSQPSAQGQGSAVGSSGEELLRLDDTNDWSVDSFKANLLVDLSRGDVTRVAQSDIGFLALSYGAGLAIVDLRGPDVILREGMGDDFTVAASSEKGKGKGPKRSERKLIEAESKAPISSMTWTICRSPGAYQAHHAILAPRLIVTRTNGLVSVLTMVHALDMWMPERTGAVKVEEMESNGLAVRSGISVLDIAGNLAEASPMQLQRSVRDFGRVTGSEEMIDSDVPLLLGWSGPILWLGVGLTSGRLFKVNTSEPILAAAVVERHMEKVVVAISNTSVRIYSAPKLDLITRIQRHHREHGDQTTSASNVSIDEGPSGNFLDVLSSLDVRLWTFFGHVPRPAQPALLLWVPKPVPAHPGAGAVGSIASWFSTKAATTSPLDDVMAGPNRAPAPPQLPKAKTKEDFVSAITGLPPAPAESGRRPTEQGTLAESAYSTFSGKSTVPSKPHSTAPIVASTQDTQGAMWDNLDLARRRGEAMEGLENSLASLEKSANSWVREAKSGLLKSAAKDKLSKFGL